MPTILILIHPHPIFRPSYGCVLYLQARLGIVTMTNKLFALSFPNGRLQLRSGFENKVKVIILRTYCIGKCKYLYMFKSYQRDMDRTHLQPFVILKLDLSINSKFQYISNSKVSKVWTEQLIRLIEQMRLHTLESGINIALHLSVF